MSRFADFSLYKRTEDLLRPAEKDLSGAFHSTENIQLLYKRAQTEVDSDISYSDVTLAMDYVFRLALTSEKLPRVTDMNTSVLRKLIDAAERMTTSQKRYADRTFGNSNVPAQFLPRPSFRVSEDKGKENNTFNLFRK